MFSKSSIEKISLAWSDFLSSIFLSSHTVSIPLVSMAVTAEDKRKLTLLVKEQGKRTWFGFCDLLFCVPVMSKITHLSVLSLFAAICSSSSRIHLNTLHFEEFHKSEHHGKKLKRWEKKKKKNWPFLDVSRIGKVDGWFNSKYEKRRNPWSLSISGQVLVDLGSLNIS